MWFNLVTILCYDQTKASLSVITPIYSGVRRIFEREGWAENWRIMKTKRKISPLRISPFFCPKLGEDQKKKVPLRWSVVFGPKLGENQKKDPTQI